jgi:hypothetical protein
MFGARRLRWPVGLGLLLLLAVACAGIGAADSATPAVDFTVNVDAAETGQAMPSGFLGFSLEYAAIHEYLGRNSAALDPVFLQLVQQLNPGQQPVLRIGGDSTDHTWFPIPGVVEPAGVSYDLNSNWIATVKSAAQQLNARLILGVNLAADSPSLAGAEARALITGIGSQYVDALEIGNEPDAYTDFAWYQTRTDQVGFARGSSWTEPAYEQEVGEWADAVPQVPLAGPADAYTGWMDSLSSLVHSEPRLNLVTFHRYPLRGCGANATGALAPTMSNLLDDASSAGLAQTVAPYVGVAHANGLPLRVDELNSASCGGTPGLSNTFGSSLWMLDTLFNMASVGVDGVNVHTLPGAAYAPFSFSLTQGVWHATVNPIYYGMLMFSQAFPPGAQLLGTSTDTTGSGQTVRVWSTRDADGNIRTVLINESGDNATVHLHLAGRGSTPVTVESLTAPSLTSTTGVSLGGQSFTANTTTGMLAAPTRSTVGPIGNQYTVSVPAGSAALVTSDA